MADEITVDRVIAAPPDELWARVADPSGMGDLSPESAGGTWLKGATGPAVGAKFKGNNQNGKKQWSTTGTVVECEPGHVVRVRRDRGPVQGVALGLPLRPGEGGCKVTETWTDPGAVARFLGKPVSGVADRASHNRATMEATLARLAELSEAAAS